MLFRNFLKLFLSSILCVFMQASAMLNEHEMMTLENLGQTLLARNYGENAETNSQLRGFIKNLPLFIQENLPQIMQKLDNRGTLTLENVIQSCVDSLIAKLKLNKQDSALCKAFVAEDFKKCLALRNKQNSERRSVFIGAPFSIARTLMFAFVFFLCITTGQAFCSSNKTYDDEASVCDIGTNTGASAPIKQCYPGTSEEIEYRFCRFKDGNVDLLFQERINKLKPYYHAIHSIRTTLEEAASKFDGYRTGFSLWPEPNPFYCRTPKYIFLETSSRGKREYLSTLHTPFGEVKLGGIGGTHIELSRTFFDNMDWELEDVTQNVKVFEVFNDKKYGPYRFHKESWEGARDICKLYLIKSVNSINISQEYASGDELIIFDSFGYDPEQYKYDKKIFECLSEGKNEF